MLFKSILLKDRELTKKIRDDSSPQREEIDSLLNAIIYSSKMPLNSEYLRHVFVLFRKWYNLFIHYYGYEYDKSIFSYEWDYKEKRDTYAFSSFFKTITKTSDQESISNYINLLTKYVNPYATFYKKNLSKIDSSFYEKYSVLELLIKATDEFKVSNINESKLFYYKVTNIFENKKHQDNTMLYFYSWALHGLGNIELLKYNYGKAFSLYSNAVKLKEQIEGLPSLILYSTITKQAIASLANLPVKDWNRNIHKVLVVLSNKARVSEDNPSWYYNLLLDLNFMVSKSLRYMGKNEEAKLFCETAIEKAKKWDDQVGLIRCYVLLAMINRKDSTLLKKIAKTLNKIPPKKRNDPYLRRMLSVPYLKEVELSDAKLRKSIQDIFKQHKILPLDISR